MLQIIKNYVIKINYFKTKKFLLLIKILLSRITADLVGSKYSLYID